MSTYEAPGRIAARRGGRAANLAARREPISIVIPLFIISILIPIYFFIGTFRLSPYRVILIVFFIPTFITWISGGIERIRAADMLILASALWGGIALVVNNGIEEAFQPAGILLVETFGSYLLARRYIRNAASFFLMTRTLFFAILCLIPFAAYESFTGHAPILDAVSKIFNTFHTHYMEPRFGLKRAMVVFEHPILFGTFCASAFGLTFYSYVYNKLFPAVLRSALIVVSAIFSVSTGAAASIMVQCFLIIWNRIFRNLKEKWHILIIAIVVLYVMVDTLSNRSPFHVFVTYLTFSTGSAYGRILIWDYGTAEVARHPVFGIGLNDWERPSWMSGSMDNFWLVVAVTYGLPAFLLLSFGILSIIIGIARLRIEDRVLSAYRRGLLVSLGGLILAGGTVHYWNAIYCWFIFLVGSGVWLLDGSSDKSSSNKKRTKRMYA